MTSGAASSNLEEAMRSLGESVSSMVGGGASSQLVLKDVFRVNNELGRLVRSGSPGKTGFVELQSEINLLTLHVKSGRLPEALAAFREAEKMFGTLSLPSAEREQVREPKQ